MNEEVDTDGIIKHSLESNKNLFVPYFDKDKMVMVKIDNFQDYTSLPFDTYGVRWVEKLFKIMSSKLRATTLSGI